MKKLKPSTTTLIFGVLAALINLIADSDNLYFFSVAFLAASFICQAVEGSNDK